MASSSATVDQKTLSFQGEGFSWDEYIKYRPTYPASVFERIYAHHASLPSNTFDTVMDVGAGGGIASTTLAFKFSKVIVSEPNLEHLRIARQNLSSLKFSSTAFEFLAEAAEKSTLGDKSVDCLCIFEALHWADISTSIATFARLLKPGGTLNIIYYGPAKILDHEAASKVWTELLLDYVDYYRDNAGIQRAAKSICIGFDNIEFEEGIWGNVVRRFGNADGERCLHPIPRYGLELFPDKVGMNEKRIFVEDKEGWEIEDCDLAWFQQVFMNYFLGRKLEDDKERWRQLEDALGGRDGKVQVVFPNLQILATRK
ncbi:hypothetical protein B7494_g1767 [Chlorociboria aeruginascens]|nr:hypothetical protein B7494_g1767 [Chlorociboria aeruginascens]